MYEGKYLPLYEYLNKTETDSITLSYKEIEEILKFSLTKSAYIHRAWWANDTGHHTQAKSWLQAGWKTVNVELRKSITFSRFYLPNQER